MVQVLQHLELHTNTAMLCVYLQKALPSGLLPSLGTRQTPFPAGVRLAVPQHSGLVAYGTAMCILRLALLAVPQRCTVLQAVSTMSEGQLASGRSQGVTGLVLPVIGVTRVQAGRLSHQVRAGRARQEEEFDGEH